MSKIKKSMTFTKFICKTHYNCCIMRERERMWAFELKRELTSGVGKAKGDGAVWNTTHVPDGHLTGVISKVLWTEVFQFQHLCLALQTHTHSHITQNSFSVRQSMHLHIMTTTCCLSVILWKSAICAFRIFFCIIWLLLSNSYFKFENTFSNLGHHRVTEVQTTKYYPKNNNTKLQYKVADFNWNIKSETGNVTA